MAPRYPTDVRREDLPLPNRQLMDSLAELMQSRQINGSDVARMSGLHRDNISRWARGSSFPTLDLLEKLARGLRVQLLDLVPCLSDESVKDELMSRKPRGRTGVATATHSPVLAIETSVEDPGMAWLRVNRLLPRSVARQIFQLIEDSDEAARNATADRAASG